jgi:Na+/H+ antiporter NhaD/arsenite permease-like protein
MKKEKLIFISAAVGLLFLVATFILWFIKAVEKNDLEGMTLAIPIVIIIITALMLPILLRNYKSIKENIPTADERSKKAATRAAALTFYISIYLLLAIGWFGDDYFERPSQATGLGILGMAVIFLATWIYFDRRGKL